MKKKLLTSVATATCFISNLFAAGDANNALKTATESVSQVFENASNLMLAVAAIIGIIGAIQAYTKFNSGDREGAMVIAKWAGGLIFICLVPAILKAFFL